MSSVNVALLLLYAVGMSAGQMLFKMSADAAKRGGEGRFLAALLGTWQFYAAIVVYGGLALAWIWILTRVPLSRAYPFVVLAFVLTPILAVVFFGETVGARYVFALTLILVGLGVLTTGSG